MVAVPSKGVERWISQSLAAVLGTSPDGHDGVCANVVFPSPARLVDDAVTAAVDIDTDNDPWAEPRLPWSLLEVIDRCATEDWCRTLGRHLGLVDGGVDQGRRMAVAKKLARLYTSYGAQRPTMLLDWYSGRDTDGSDLALEPDHAWQAELWRRLRHSIGLASPAERMAAACSRLRDEPVVVDLPERLSIFGPTRLTTAQLQVIDALAARRDSHLWLPPPSDRLWRRMADDAMALGGHQDTNAPRGRATAGSPIVTIRRDDHTVDLPVHPLLRSLARDARELQLRMHTHLDTSTDDHDAVGTTADDVLQTLPQDIRNDMAPSLRHTLADDDTSLQVHACHGRQRQVEVLREVLLGLLAEDPTLELRDIIVMCPDIESYAPLISAAFGLSANDVGRTFTKAHPGHRLTVRLADRSLRQTNPILNVVARLLELADARITVTEVLDLAAMPAVRRRFGFDDDGLTRVSDWVRASGVRWGFDAATRAPFGLGQVSQNTWQSGLDRVLVGVAMDENHSRTFNDALPLDDVDSSDIHLAGRLAELVDRLAAAVGALSSSQPLDAWVTALIDSVDSLVDVPPREAWQLSQARRQLTEAVSVADERLTSTTLGLSDIRALLADQLRGRPTRANFRTGYLTMCTMVPMRSVPHRVVCLLGLDDGVFPRGASIDGDDILARRPRVGERDARSEDRQLFLDAILAARERLVIVYTGADERTGARRPPAVPLGELLDVLDVTAHSPHGLVREQILREHPLQPFDARNFQPGALTPGSSPFSYDTAAYDGSHAVCADRPARPPFLSNALAVEELEATISLEALGRFLEHPVKQFLRQRLKLSTTEEGHEAQEAIPVNLNGLEQWAVGDRLLDAGLNCHGKNAAVRAEVLRGLLPPGELGTAILDPILDEVTALLVASQDLRRHTREHHDVSIPLRSGVTIAGTVAAVYSDRVVRVVYSKLAAKHRLRAWVQLLALCASSPDRAWKAVTVGRGQRGGAMSSTMAGMSRDDAVQHLEDLVAVYRAGLGIPLPLPPAAAAAYAGKRRSGCSVAVAEALAGKEWRNSAPWGESGEFDDADHKRVWGDVHLGKLLEVPADPADTRWPDEPHRFGQLARSVWTPLLDCETVASS